MGNCKDCRHWEHVHTVWNEKYTQCTAVEWYEPKDVIGEYDFAIYANASDDTGLRAGLKTGPLFGCVQFQHDYEGQN